MGNMGKSLAMVLILVMAISCASLLIVKPSSAQIVPKPSVPEFTVKFVNASYNIVTTNPYTGKSQTQQVNNDSIQLLITNQPLNYPSNYQIYFGVRLKPHFAGNWTELGALSYQQPSSYNPNDNSFHDYLYYISYFAAMQSSGNYTVIAFSVLPSNVSQTSGYEIQLTPEGESGSGLLSIIPDGGNGGLLSSIPDGGQIDCQVEAIVGHNSTYWYLDADLPPPDQGHQVPAIAYDSNSSWSNTQTVTIGQTSSVPEFPAIAILPLLLSMLPVAVIVRHRKNR